MKQTIIIALFALLAIGTQAQPTIRYASTRSRAFANYGTGRYHDRQSDFSTITGPVESYKPVTAGRSTGYNITTARGERAGIVSDRVTFDDRRAGRGSIDTRSNAGRSYASNTTIPGAARPADIRGSEIFNPIENIMPGIGGPLRLGGGGVTHNPNGHDGGYGEPPREDTPVGGAVPVLALMAFGFAALKLRRL